MKKTVKKSLIDGAKKWYSKEVFARIDRRVAQIEERWDDFIALEKKATTAEKAAKYYIEKIG